LNRETLLGFEIRVHSVQHEEKWILNICVDDIMHAAQVEYKIVALNAYIYSPSTFDTYTYICMYLATQVLGTG
jgi:hypothetical protein